MAGLFKDFLIDSPWVQSFWSAVKGRRRVLTAAEYAALSEEEKNADVVYMVPEEEGGGSSGGGIPSGFIGIWSGAAANIPDGWALCDGSNGTPDLRGRFVVGAAAPYESEPDAPPPNEFDWFVPGDTGGEATHRLTAGEMPAHTHGIPTSGGSNSSVSGSYVSVNSGKIRTDTLFTAANGLTEAHNNMPPYYALCYIMKL